MGLVRAVVTVAVCRILDHDLRYLTDWAGKWALKHGWYLYRCERCGKRVRMEQPLMEGDGWVELWP